MLLKFIPQGTKVRVIGAGPLEEVPNGISSLKAGRFGLVELGRLTYADKLAN